MKGNRPRIMTTAAFALAALSGMGFNVAQVNTAQNVNAQTGQQGPQAANSGGQVATARQRFIAGSSTAFGYSYPKKNGWSVAEGKRRARKARNIKRHRAHA